MPNFKVGDIVRGIDSSRYQCTNSDMTKGKVTYIRSDGYFDCIILEHKHPEKASCEIGCEHTFLDPKYFELVPKFAVGQIYRVGKLSCQHQYENAIIKLTEKRHFGFAIKAIRGEAPDDFMKGSEYARALTPLTGKQIGEAIKAFDEKKTGGVKEVKRAAKVGETIKIVEPNSTFDGYKSGDTAKVTNSFRTGVFADFGCGNRGVYNREYVVLEGYSPVKEVKRRAQVGEYLKVVDASVTRDYNYSNGDIMKCTFVGSCGIQAKLCAKYGTLVDHEYVVLEGYKPEQKGEWCKAKAGDSIKIVKNGFGVAAKNGAVGTVVSVNCGGVSAKFPPFMDAYSFPYNISDDEYVIVSSGKHIWTPGEIARAKDFVLDTIREIYEESKGSIVFSRDVDSDKIFDAYLIEKGFSRLGYRPLDDSLIAHKVRRGTAKCSSTDEPNEWIGKCVALCKALHKPIPSFIMGD